MMCPRVSVVIPVFRSEQVLARALGSLLAQDQRDWEALVVDDGSPESSWRVTQAYAWIDPRIRTMRQPHAGVCAARNAGIKPARGEYLLFLDADDWLEPHAISTLNAACAGQGRDAVHGTFRYTMPDGSPTEWSGGHDAGATPLFEALCSSNVLSVPACVMVRRSMLDDVGGFDTILAHCGDWDLWGRVARDAEAVGHVGDCIASYRMSQGSLSRNPRTLMRDAMTVLHRLHGRDDRVRRAHARFERGSDRERLAERITHFAVHAAGLAAATANDSAADAVLDLVPRWTPISPERAGAFLYYSMCFAHCCGPESVATFWPTAAEGVHRLVASLERRTRNVGLADDILAVITALSDGRISRLADRKPASHRAADRPAPVMADTMAYETLRLLAGRGADA